MTKESENDGDLKVVFQAPDQITADLVQSFLVAEGIPSMLRPRKGNYAAAKGRFYIRKYEWGDIIAPVKYVDQCREIISAYLAGVPEDVIEEEAK